MTSGHSARSLIALSTVLAGLLPACAGGESEADLPSLIPAALRGRLCDTIANSHRCARAIEARQLQASERIERTDRGVCFELRGERCVPDDSSFAYSYLGTLSRPPYHVLWAQYVEGNRILLVDVSTGTGIRVDAIPVPSPDGEFLAVASADLMARYNPNRLTIFEVVEDTLLEVWSIEPERWGPAAVWWMSDTRLGVETMVLDTVRFEQVIDDTAVVEKSDDGWGLTRDGR